MDTTILTYLSSLERNNTREWYHEHKNDRQIANKEFETMVQDLMFEIGKTDPSILGHEPKDLTFKQVRDTRFSHDKSPYNPTLRCHISSAGKLPIPVGYFLAIRPGDQSFLGGGLFTDIFKEATEMVRKHIAANAEEFLSIITAPEFTEDFTVKGTALKNVPAGYQADSPAAKYLKHKSWYLELPVKDRMFEDSALFVEYASEKFLSMKPFNDFLNRALEGFVMPSR